MDPSVEAGACYGVTKSTSPIVRAAAAPFSPVQPAALGGAGLSAVSLVSSVEGFSAPVLLSLCGGEHFIT